MTAYSLCTEPLGIPLRESVATRILINLVRRPANTNRMYQMKFIQSIEHEKLASTDSPFKDGFNRRHRTKKQHLNKERQRDKWLINHFRLELIIFQ